MIRGWVLALVFSASACKSDEAKLCFDGAHDAPHRESACGQECDRGKEEACAKQTELGLQRCMKDKNAEVCGWMCRYGNAGQDLYCKEYEGITGKKPD
jgi:hypothetical protein